MQGPSAGITLSQSHLFSFPMGGSLCRDKHGRGVLATASSQGKRRWLCGAAGFRVERWQRSQGKQRAASWHPASAQAALARWHGKHPALGRPADLLRHLRHVPDPFLWSHPPHSCTNLMRNPRFERENTRLCPASSYPSRARRSAPESEEGHGGSRSDCHSSGHLTERGQSCKPLHETGGMDAFEQTDRSKNNVGGGGIE